MFWNNAVSGFSLHFVLPHKSAADQMKSFSGITDIMPFWLKSFNVKGQPVVYTVPQINQ